MGWLNVLLLFCLYCFARGIYIDECLKRTLICEKLKITISSGTELFPTDSAEIDEICRVNKDFLICISKASEYCAESGTINDLAAEILGNRMGLRMLCSNESWKKDYLGAVSCINKIYKKEWNKCREDEDELSFKCYAPDMCKMTKRLINCTMKALKNDCIFFAADIFRRIYFLDKYDEDIICEFRIRISGNCNSLYPIAYRVHLQFTLQTEFQKRSTEHFVTIEEVTDALTEVVSSLLTYIRKNIEKNNDLVYQKIANESMSDYKKVSLVKTLDKLTEMILNSRKLIKAQIVILNNLLTSNSEYTDKNIEQVDNFETDYTMKEMFPTEAMNDFAITKASLITNEDVKQDASFETDCPVRESPPIITINDLNIKENSIADDGGAAELTPSYVESLTYNSDFNLELSDNSKIFEGNFFESLSNVLKQLREIEKILNQKLSEETAEIAIPLHLKITFLLTNTD